MDVAEQAERYHFGRLLPEEAALFEEHFLACGSCTEELQRAESFAAAMRAAARRLMESPKKSRKARPRR